MQGQAEDRGALCLAGPAGWEQICRQVRVGAVLLADKVKPPVGIRGEPVHGKEGSVAAQVGEQWGALSSAWRTYPVRLRDDAVASSRLGLCLMGRRMRYQGR